MRSSLSRLIDSLQLRFLHIKTFAVNHTFRSEPRVLPHSVLWQVEEGTFDFTLDAAAHRGAANQIIFLPPRASLTFTALSRHISVTSINFDAEIAFSPKRVWSEVLRFPVRHDYSSRAREEVQTIYEQMRAQAAGDSVSLQLMQQSNLGRIVALLLQDIYQSRNSDAPHAQDSRVEAVIEYLLCHADRFPELSELCALVGLSESHLRKLFVEHTGLPVRQFILHFKIDSAKKLLVTTDARISDIAYEFGFADPNHFAKQFRKKTGHAPHSYREKFREPLSEP